MVTTVIQNLLGRKQKLVEPKAIAANEREEIERQVEQVNTALHFLDGRDPTESSL